MARGFVPACVLVYSVSWPTGQVNGPAASEQYRFLANFEDPCDRNCCLIWANPTDWTIRDSDVLLVLYSTVDPVFEAEPVENCKATLPTWDTNAFEATLEPPLKVGNWRCSPPFSRPGPRRTNSFPAHLEGIYCKSLRIPMSQAISWKIIVHLWRK